MLNQKMFIQIWGPHLEAAGYIRKGNGYYFIMPNEQIIKLVRMENLGGGWYRIVIDIACYADDINMDLFKRGFRSCYDLTNLFSTLRKEVYAGILDNRYPEQSLERDFQTFESHILPNMESVRSVEECYRFHRRYDELILGEFIMGSHERLFECIQCGWYDEALIHAEKGYPFSKEEYERLRSNYEASPNGDDTLVRMAEKDFKLYSMCLSALRAGAYDLLNKELQMRIERSRKSCSKFFGWRM